MRARRACGLLCAAALFGSTAQAAPADACTPWPEWQAFKRLYVSDDGRVVDASTPEAATVSEGQAYALTFALIADDPASFARILAWTANNLSAGDPAHVLPAWRWGRSGDGSWTVLDRNSASDADLWMAYALAEAGRLWHNSAYTQAARAMMALILREEVALVPGLGATVLPGPRGFVSHGAWRLNASYLPIQVLRALQQEGDAALWTEALESSGRIIIGSAPRGYAADWILYREGQGFAADPATHGAGSYNAIRVYLWAGMLSEDEPQAERLVRQLEPMARIAARGAAPESIDTVTLEAQGEAPAGFLAALLPLLAHFRLDAAVGTTAKRLRAQALRDNQHYYNDVLTLFGLGWLDDRFRFDRHGNLRLPWNGSCRAD
jgi:endo-1,4-beta-D-glucanase Y